MIAKTLFNVALVVSIIMICRSLMGKAKPWVFVVAMVFWTLYAAVSVIVKM